MTAPRAMRGRRDFDGACSECIDGRLSPRGDTELVCDRCGHTVEAPGRPLPHGLTVARQALDAARARVEEATP